MADTASEFQQLIAQAAAVAPDNKTAEAALALLKTGAGALPASTLTAAAPTPLSNVSTDAP